MSAMSREQREYLADIRLDGGMAMSLDESHPVGWLTGSAISLIRDALGLNLAAIELHGWLNRAYGVEDARSLDSIATPTGEAVRLILAKLGELEQYGHLPAGVSVRVQRGMVYLDGLDGLDLDAPSAVADVDAPDWWDAARERVQATRGRVWGEHASVPVGMRDIIGDALAAVAFADDANGYPYSGAGVYASNLRHVRDHAPEQYGIKGDCWRDGYGYLTVPMLAETLTSSQLHELLGAIDGAAGSDGYPVMCDECHSAVEADAQADALESHYGERVTLDHLQAAYSTGALDDMPGDWDGDSWYLDDDARARIAEVVLAPRLASAVVGRFGGVVELDDDAPGYCLADLSSSSLAWHPVRVADELHAVASALGGDAADLATLVGCGMVGRELQGLDSELAHPMQPGDELPDWIAGAVARRMDETLEDALQAFGSALGGLYVATVDDGSLYVAVAS